MTKKLLIACVSLLLLLTGTPGGAQQKAKSADVLMGTAMHQEEVEGNLEAAIATYKSVIAASGGDRALAARAQVRIGQCYEKLGNVEARKAYEIVLSQYADQAEPARVARERLGALQGGAAAPKSTEPSVRRLWVPEGRGWSAASVSHDGRAILYTDWNTGDLWAHDFGTGKNTRVTDSGPNADCSTFAESAVFSPDDKRVAFSWYNEAGKYDLRIVEIGGAKPKVIFTCDAPGEDFWPSDWSGDERFIVGSLYQKGKPNDMALIGTRDGSLRRIKTATSEGGKFSPDGRFVAFGKKGLIGVIEVESGREAPLDEHPANTDLLGWTPDGKSVVFTSERSGTNDVWLLSVSEGKPQGSPQFIKKAIPSKGSLDLARTGAFFYSETREISDVQIAELDPATGKLVSPPQKASRRWTGITRTPAWSPDGRTLAYICDYTPGKERNLILRSDETGEEREIKTKMSFMGLSLRWSKDGRTLSMGARDEQSRGGLFRIDVQSGESTFDLLSIDGLRIPRFEISADGKIGYASVAAPGKPNMTNLIARDLASGKDTVLLTRVAITSAELSPDGRKLAVLAMREDSPDLSVLVMPAEGGEPQEIARIEAKEATARVAPVWTPDGRSIYFVKGKRGAPDRDVQLWKVSAEGGTPQRLGLTVDELWWISPHPDGRRIAFGDWRGQSEIWAIENFLPKTEVSRKAP